MVFYYHQPSFVTEIFLNANRDFTYELKFFNISKIDKIKKHFYMKMLYEL